MEKVRYMISDAANLIQVESHVLRYWEEELELDVPRNEMGHRYYTEENIRQFEQIKKLKEEGFQLKAIRMLIHNPPAEEESADDLQIDLEKETASMLQETDDPAWSEASAAWKESVRPALDAETIAAAQEQPLSKLEQFQMMMNEIVKNAMTENNHALGAEISMQVGEKVIKEMNYLMREREEQEEERFRKLDEIIRSRQKRPKKEKRTFFRTSIHKAEEMS